MIDIIDVRTSPATIKVLGVGGGGSNAIGRMIQAGLAGVEFWVANTDLQALENSPCPNRIQLGRAVTRGLGAGGDPEIGRLSAEEDREAIAAVLQGTDMLFVTAGMGGGTGTGGAPVVAAVARELGILTVAIVSKPFLFEGRKKMARAVAGLELLGGQVDTLIAIPNQKLLNIVQPGTPFSAAMLVADEVLLQATRGISDLITGHGVINLDFADVKTVMHNRGNALLGCGVGSGSNRALEAAQGAVSSPLLEEVSIFGAEALLINVHGGPDMGLHEAAEATQFISDRVGEEADVFWGAVVDPSLGDEMRVTIIATGFARDSQTAQVRKDEPRAAAWLPPSPASGPAPVVPVPIALAGTPLSVLGPVSLGTFASPSPAAAAGVAASGGTPVPFPVRAAGEAQMGAMADGAPLAAPVTLPASGTLSGDDETASARAADPDRSPWGRPVLDPQRPAATVRPERSIWEVDPVSLDAELFVAPGEPAAVPVRADRTERAAGPLPGAERGPGDGRDRNWAIGLGADWSSPTDRDWSADRTATAPRRDAGLDGRLGRNPLDRPAFMRKRMD